MRVLHLTFTPFKLKPEHGGRKRRDFWAKIEWIPEGERNQKKSTGTIRNEPNDTKKWKSAPPVWQRQWYEQWNWRQSHWSTLYVLNCKQDFSSVTVCRMILLWCGWPCWQTAKPHWRNSCGSQLARRIRQEWVWLESINRHINWWSWEILPGEDGSVKAWRRASESTGMPSWAGMWISDLFWDRKAKQKWRKDWKMWLYSWSWSDSCSQSIWYIMWSVCQEKQREEANKQLGNNLTQLQLNEGNSKRKKDKSKIQAPADAASGGSRSTISFGTATTSSTKHTITGTPTSKKGTATWSYKN